jgi:hypothetical protein
LHDAVDPKKFEHLDRRSTILLTAARAGTEDQEKHEITAMEEREFDFFATCGYRLLTSPGLPIDATAGMDALRGGFGTVGSIIRARSGRRTSNASSLVSPGGAGRPGFGYPFGGRSAAGMQMSDVPRYARESDLYSGDP